MGFTTTLQNTSYFKLDSGGRVTKLLVDPDTPRLDDDDDHKVMPLKIDDDLFP